MRTGSLIPRLTAPLIALTLIAASLLTGCGTGPSFSEEGGIFARVGVSMCIDLGLPPATQIEDRSGELTIDSGSPCGQFGNCIVNHPQHEYNALGPCYMNLARATSGRFSTDEIAQIFVCRRNGYTTASCVESVTSTDGCLHNGGSPYDCRASLVSCSEQVRADPPADTVEVASLIADRRADVTPAAGPTCPWQHHLPGSGVG